MWFKTITKPVFALVELFESVTMAGEGMVVMSMDVVGGVVTEDK